MRRSFIVAVLCGVAAAAQPASQSTDALARLRAALGGEAILTTITSVHASGKLKVVATPNAGSVEFYFEAPDRFVRIERLPPQVPPLPNATYRPGANAGQGVLDATIPHTGFTSDETVRTTRVGFGGSVPLLTEPGRGGLTPADLGKILTRARRQYAQFALPLFGGTTFAYHVDAEATAGGNITFRSTDGGEWHLSIDPATSLPAAMWWTDYPPNNADARRAIGAESSWHMAFADYRRVGQVTWPHRITITIDGHPYEEITIKEYELNKTIPARVFRGQ